MSTRAQLPWMTFEKDIFKNYFLRTTTHVVVRHFRETFQQIEFDKEAYIKVQTDVNFPNQVTNSFSKIIS